jgi:hypothetical protein
VASPWSAYKWDPTSRRQSVDLLVSHNPDLDVAYAVHVPSENIAARDRADA